MLRCAEQPSNSDGFITERLYYNKGYQDVVTSIPFVGIFYKRFVV